MNERPAETASYHLAPDLVVGPVPVLLYGRRAWVALAPVVIQKGVDGPITLVCPFPSEIDYSLHAETRTRLTSSHHVGAFRPGDRSHTLM